MEISKSAIIDTLNTNNYIVTKSFEELTDDHFFERPNDFCNPIHFIMGHITLYRYQGCKLLGDDSSYTFADLYAMSAKVQDRAKYPSADEIKDEWQSISDKLIKLLENSDIEAFSKEIPNKYPIGEKNVMGGFQFLMYHEAYHLGQVALVRRYHGYAGPIG